MVGNSQASSSREDRFVVFIDTGPLLRMWKYWRKGQQIKSPCFTDNTVSRVTSYKCVAEILNVSRGRASKKLRDCQDKVLYFLGQKYVDATPLGLANALHISGGTNELRSAIAAWRYANARWQRKPDPNLIAAFLSEGDQERVQSDWDRDKPLHDAVKLHQGLLNDIELFLNQCKIRILHADGIFTPDTLGDWISFIEEGIVGNEDLEIVFAAEVAHADLFITDDIQLIRDSLSFGIHGHNFSRVRPLTFPCFWHEKQYYKYAIRRLKDGKLYKNLDEIEPKGD